MLNLVQLNYFQVTARCESFAKACEVANITQPALSNAIKTLEERLGFRLFDRNERPIRLTPRGRTLLEEVDRLLFQGRNVEIMVQALRDGEAGHVRLGTTAAFASAFGGQAAAMWLREHPKMTLDVLVRPTPILLDKLLSEDLDVIVGITSELQPGSGMLDILHLPSQSGHAFVRKGHVALQKDALTPEDIDQFGLAASHYAPLVLAQFAERLGYEKAQDLPIVVNSENTSLLCDLTANSDLVLLSTRESTRHSTALGQLVELDVDLITAADWSIAKRRGRRQLPGADALVGFIQSMLEQGIAKLPTTV